MMAATFCYLLPTREMVMSNEVPDIGRFIALAERAEELGFDSIWAGDSVLARPRLEALTTLAAVASRTSQAHMLLRFPYRVELPVSGADLNCAVASFRRRSHNSASGWKTPLQSTIRVDSAVLTTPSTSARRLGTGSGSAGERN